MVSEANNGRRELFVAAGLAVLGSGLALYATTRGWWVKVTPRPAPIPDRQIWLTGRDIAPWITALAFPGLAGGIAILATKAITRTAIAILVAVVGASIAAGGVAEVIAAPHIQSSRIVWPIAVIGGGLAVLASGLLVLVRHRRWQVAAMGSRFDSPTRPQNAYNSDSLPQKSATSLADPAHIWDDLDRGIDPTNLTDSGQPARTVLAPGERSEAAR